MVPCASITCDSRVKVTLHKPGAVRGSKDVGIIIERETADYPAEDADA